MKKFILASLAAVALVVPQAVFAADAPVLVSTAVLPDITLKSASNAAIADSVANDQGVLLGGLGLVDHPLALLVCSLALG